jgi:hypothetical protein
MTGKPSSLASSALFRNPAEHRREREAALQALSEQEVQPRLIPRLEQQGGKLRAVWTPATEPDDINIEFKANFDQSFDEATLGTEKESSLERSLRVQARFEALYEDHKARATRREAEWQKRLQGDVSLRMAQSTKSTKTFDVDAFEDKYDIRIRTLRQKQAERESRRLLHAEQKKDKETEGCTFKPKLISRSPNQREAVGIRKKLGEVAEKLSCSQKPLLEQLKKIQEEQDVMEKELRRDCEDAIAKAQEENQQNVKRFLQTEAGRRALMERAVAYAEANPGIESDRAELEAHSDIVTSNEEQLKQRLLNAFREKRHMARQRSQIRRLQVVHELIKLESEYSEVVGTSKTAKALVKNFDVDLVAKVKQQPWYIVARATAAQAKERSPT